VGVCKCGFCNVWVGVCMGFVMCGSFGNMCTGIYCFDVITSLVSMEYGSLAEEM
jgi:hypothetical protein